jgi:K+ transporter
VSKVFGDIGTSPIYTAQTLFDRLAGRGLGFW